MNTAELSCVCKRMRRDIITMVSNAGSGHPGGSLSMVELINGETSQQVLSFKEN